MHGVCISRKPWLLVTEFMRHKDLGGVLAKLKRQAVTVRIHELLHIAASIADCMKYLDEA